MNTMMMYPSVGTFAEDKELAKRIRMESIIPSLERNGEVTLNFQNVESATQSFMHALLSDAIRKHGVDVLDRIYFKNCNDVVKGIINIVVDYIQESML